MTEPKSRPAPAPLNPATTRNAGFVLGANWRPARAAAEVARLPARPEPAPGLKLENAPAILQGIITHYVEPDLRPRLKDSSDHLRLVEDLGLDSLSMVEVMMRVEDLLQIRVSDDQLRHFRTLGEVRHYIDRTAREMSATSRVALPSA